MSMKIVLFVLAAVVAIQGATAQESTSNRSVQNDIGKLKEKIETIVSSIKEKIGEFNKHVEETAGEVIQKGKDILTPIIEKVEAKIQEIKKETEEVHDKVKECLAEAPNATVILKNATVEIVSCITDKVKQGAGLVQDMIGLVKKAEGIANETQQAMDACDKQSVGIIATNLCKAKVTANAGQQVLEISTKVVSDVAALQALAASITVQALEVCAVNKVADIAGYMANNLLQIQQCVKQKLNQ